MFFRQRPLERSQYFHGCSWYGCPDISLTTPGPQRPVRYPTGAKMTLIPDIFRYLPGKRRDHPDESGMTTEPKKELHYVLAIKYYTFDPTFG